MLFQKLGIKIINIRVRAKKFILRQYVFFWIAVFQFGRTFHFTCILGKLRIYFRIEIETMGASICNSRY